MRRLRRVAAAVAVLVCLLAAVWFLRGARPLEGVALTFLGGAREVGGACFLVEAPGANFLVDCGAFGAAGSDVLPERPADVSFVILTHAHTDHCGLLPELFERGFDGDVYCTEPTADLVPVMLEMARSIGGRRVKREAYERALGSLRGVQFGHQVERGPVRFVFRRARHLLGAAFVEIDIDTGSGGLRVVFSGDLGSDGSLLLPPAETCARADYLVLESTYGALRRGAGEADDRFETFAAAVARALRRGGHVLIPAFTLGRTQEVLAALDLYTDRGLIPPGTLIYSDSPTANRITRIYREHPGELSELARSLYAGEPLSRPNHRPVRSGTSLRVHERPHAPAVFISSSGDLNYANSPRHLVRLAGGEENLLCIVGWQSEGSVGRRLAAGDSTVLVRYREGNATHETWVTPALEIMSFDAFSSHADQDELARWTGAIQDLRAVFLVHGELASAEALAARLASPTLSVAIPEAGERVWLRPAREVRRWAAGF